MFLNKFIYFLTNKKKFFISRKNTYERNVKWKNAFQRQIQYNIKNNTVFNINTFGTLIDYLPDNLNYVSCKNEPFYHLAAPLIQTFMLDNLVFLTNSPIRKLPPKMYIDGSLHIEYTKILTLPKDLHIEGHLYCKGTPLTKTHSESEIKNMCTIKGRIFL